MKPQKLRALAPASAVLLSCFAPLAFATGGSAPAPVSSAVGHSAAASTHAAASSGEIATAVAKTAVGAGAVASSAAGSTIQAAGSAVRAVGDSTAKAGSAVARSADQLWDFASGDPTRRPTVNRERSLPQKQAVQHRDPPPADAMAAARR